MANIGKLTKNVNGVFIGKIATLALSVVISLRPVQSDNDRAPRFEVMGRNVDGQWVQIGALYEQIMGKTGEVFYQGSISDPSFATLYFACFGQDDGSMAIAWRAPTKRRNVPMGAASGAANDGLGESDEQLDFGSKAASEAGSDVEPKKGRKTPELLAA